jgi:hypothetical protein
VTAIQLRPQAEVLYRSDVAGQDPIFTNEDPDQVDEDWGLYVNFDQFDVMAEAQRRPATCGRAADADLFVNEVLFVNSAA